MSNQVSFVYNSKNAKLGGISATYATIAGTCPSSCKLKNNGCYAGLSNAGIHSRRMDRQWAEDMKSPYALARMEANLIDAARASRAILGRPLRLHVSGDTRTRKAAAALANAAKRWHNAGGGPVYSYTHAWKTVPRKFWGQISILASVEKAKEADRAFKEGYIPAIVVSEFPNGSKSFRMKGSDLNFIPCPSQSGDATCNSCRLCMKDEKLRKTKSAIAFAAHGVQKKKVLRVIS